MFLFTPLSPACLDDVCDLKAERPGLVNELTAKEKSMEEISMKEKYVEMGNGEKGQQEYQGEEKEVNVEEEEEVEEEEGVLEEEDLEELRSQVLQLVLELEESRELSQQHEESFLELQDDVCDLKAERPGLVNELTAKEKSMEEISMKEKYVEMGNGEKGQQEYQGEEKEVNVEEEEEVEEEEGVLEEEDLEELRSQVLQLVLELEESRELSQQHEESFLELQGLLEDERLASANQAESFTRQIQRLQAKLHSVQEELDSLEEVRESELGEVQEELRSAQEEVLVLQQAGEEAAAERENDIASLQEELCRLRAELQRLRATVQEYELEITTLRAEISMKSTREEDDGELGPLTAEFRKMIIDCQTLKEDNKQLSHKLQQIQQQQASSIEADQVLRDGGEVQKDESVEAEGHITQTGNDKVLMDASIQKNSSFHGTTITDWNCPNEILALGDQLKLAEDRALQVQKQCEQLKGELVELQVLFDSSQKERTELELELYHCRAELARLCVSKSQNCTPPSESPVLSIPLIGMIVIVALIWCCWEELTS
ncbi:hypothetical protein DPEC_G00111310 [Dallia pectoralis]|uniref:Uncharacterized protein n=1 Tax=Dallia pectoralis TaxID=75939 RepID=A0ACC2GTN7_DALPE|nr:hypothetical protein DPEC_G00111310 [Dallia pectoralis]